MVPYRGCSQISASSGDNGYYCYTVGGTSCSGATVSQKYGAPAAWRKCDPAVDGSASEIKPAGATSSQSLWSTLLNMANMVVG
jgi:hypothetical protein